MPKQLTNNYSTFAVFVYQATQVTTGLLLHPYQTVQLVAKKLQFIPLMFIPLLLYGTLKFFWRLILEPLLIGGFCQSGSASLLCLLLSFVSNWVLLFCLFWQILILYLLIRFLVTFRFK